MTSLLSLPRRGFAVIACSLLTFAATAQLATASSGDAWQEFQAEVQEACLAQALNVLDVKDIFIDPFGSESYGFAVMVGTGIGSTTGYMLVCAYDKLTQKAEISGQFDL